MIPKKKLDSPLSVLVMEYCKVLLALKKILEQLPQKPVGLLARIDSTLEELEHKRLSRANKFVQAVRNLVTWRIKRKTEKSE